MLGTQESGRPCPDSSPRRRILKWTEKAGMAVVSHANKIHGGLLSKGGGGPLSYPSILALCCVLLFLQSLFGQGVLRSGPTCRSSAEREMQLSFTSLERNPQHDNTSANVSTRRTYAVRGSIPRIDLSRWNMQLNSVATKWHERQKHEFCPKCA